MLNFVRSTSKTISDFTDPGKLHELGAVECALSAVYREHTQRYAHLGDRGIEAAAEKVERAIGDLLVVGDD